MNTDHHTDLLPEKATARIFIWYHTEQSNTRKQSTGKAWKMRKATHQRTQDRGFMASKERVRQILRVEFARLSAH